MPSPFQTIEEAALAVLATGTAPDKADLAEQVAKAWNAGDLSFTFSGGPTPDRPARPDRPELIAPRDMPRRRLGGTKGRIALLHALSHIELNAIDLAFDIVARFGASMPRDFTHDWVSVGGEEGKHFNLLRARLESFSAQYGDLPAHDGLWEAAYETRNDLLARLAVVPLVLEARGLDVTPPMIDKLQKAGDPESAEILGIIYEEEKGHVAAGSRWFSFICDRDGLEPSDMFHDRVNRFFRGQLKKPFNDAARIAAGLPKKFYEPLAGS